jgi:hypothetical protein
VGKIIGFNHNFGIKPNCPPSQIIVGWAKLSDLTTIEASNQIAHQKRRIHGQIILSVASVSVGKLSRVNHQFRNFIRLPTLHEKKFLMPFYGRGAVC